MVNKLKIGDITMTIEDIKRIYTAGLEVIVDTGADKVRKHNRKRDVNLFVERGNYWVSFIGPCTVRHADGKVQHNVVSISVTCWHTDDLSEEGSEDFDNVKEAIHFLRSAVRDPKRVMKKMKTWFEE